MAFLSVVSEVSPSSAHPSGCYLCRSSDTRPGERYLDTHIEIDMEGRLLICETCVAEAADLFGFLSPKHAAELRDQLQTALADLDGANDELEHLRSGAVQAVVEVVRPYLEAQAKAAKPKPAAKAAAK